MSSVSKNLSPRPRVYDAVLADHFARNRQMAFVSGPRQSGKTTTCRRLVGAGTFLNWDLEADRALILKGQQAVADQAGLAILRTDKAALGLDEFHKFPRWKSWLKGFYDGFGDRSRIVVTGSSRLDVFRRGGDSLMGRYFPYRMHPFSAGEIVSPVLPETPLRPPVPLPEAEWEALCVHGEFPEPFGKRDPRFSRRWRDLRFQQLMREDIRDLAVIQHLPQMESLGLILAERSGGQLVYSTLATEVRVAVDTIRRWIETFTSLHYGFLVRPWFKNVAKALRKEPKWFLRDWSGIEDEGARAETFVACHLLKHVDLWTDLGMGRFELRYLRDKMQREVDFAIIRDGKPWILVEVKKADTRLSPSLAFFQTATKAPHALQLVMDLPFVDADCLARSGPLVVPARTFLSQLG